MTKCLFVSDLHGNLSRYTKLFDRLTTQKTDSVFIGGDILPGGLSHHKSANSAHRDFVNDYLVAELSQLKRNLGRDYPRIFIILGNDDGGSEETAMLEAAAQGIWEYAHNRKIIFGAFSVYGYSYIPPSPFLLKDWERYDISRYVDPGCVSPEEGYYGTTESLGERRYSTIAGDMEKLTADQNLEKSIFLFHTPPHDTYLDRAALDGKTIDGVSLDLHVGSIAVRRFIESRQPYLTLHGHVHESARLSGYWQDKLGNTAMFTAAHDGPELALISFELENLSSAQRELL